MLSAVVLLAACGGSDSPTPTVTTASEGGSSGIAQAGDTVKVHYRGTLDDGSEFDSSLGGEPLRFTLGSGQVIEGFDAAVEGLSVGEKITARMEPADAYGERSDALIIDLPRSGAPTDLLIGASIQFTSESGTPVSAVVVGLSRSTITLDANHALAGQALTFEIELVEIE